MPKSWLQIPFLGLIILLLPLAGAPAREPAIPILVYHRFDPAASGLTTLPVPMFEQQLDWLAAHHAHIVPLSQALSWLLGNAPAPPLPAAVITVDDGNETVFTRLFPIVLRRHIPVTLFIYPSAISNASYALTWAQLAQMRQSGLVDVQSHTYWHPDFRIEKSRRGPAEYRAFVDFQLARSRAILETRLGAPVTLLAWPYGIVDPELEAAARRAGYRAGFAFAGGLAGRGADPLAIPRIPVAGFITLPGFAALLAPALQAPR